MNWNDRVMERCGPEVAVEVEAAPRIYRGPAVDRDADLVERLRRHEAGASSSHDVAFRSTPRPRRF